MKALILADLHTQDERKLIPDEVFESCNFIISVGDISGTKKRIEGDLGTRQDFNFPLPVIGVLGNHENWDLVRTKSYGLKDVHMKVMNYKGLKFAGVGGVIAKNPRRIYHNNRDEVVKWIKSLIKQKKKIDVFVMHEPPYKCFDFVRGKNRGVEEYREPLIKLAPRWLFVGHMHTYRGTIEWPTGTTVVNPGMALKGEYAILDVGKEKITFSR